MVIIVLMVLIVVMVIFFMASLWSSCLITSLSQIQRLYHEHEIANLTDFTTTVKEKEVTIKFTVLNMMHDGKEIVSIVKDILK